MTRSQPLLAPALLLGTLLASPAFAQTAAEGDWPWWRGPNHNGIAAEGQQPPVSWSDSKNVVWKTPVPGRGHASPTVVGDRIFLATADERSKVQSVVAFDRKTGKQLWKTDVHRGGFPRKIHRKNTYASPTVASDGERLFAVFHNSNAIQCTALGLDGKKRWQKIASPFTPKQYEHGYGASPIIYKSVVVIAADYDGSACLVALDRKSGRMKWRAPRPSNCNYSSPVVARVAGRDQLLISGSDIVASYDPNSGRRLWQTKATTSAVCGTIVWQGPLVFASGGYPRAGTYCILANGSGRIVWQNRKKCYEQSMLAHDGYIYAVDDGGVAICWKATDGTEMWSHRLGGAVCASPILAGGNVYLSNERGTTFVFKADPKGFQEVAQNQLGSEAFASPTICGGRIYLRVARNEGGGRQEYLYCIGKE